MTSENRFFESLAGLALLAWDARLSGRLHAPELADAAGLIRGQAAEKSGWCSAGRSFQIVLFLYFFEI